MRVLIWTENFRTAIGGVEVFVERLVASLVGRGIDLTVVASKNKPHLRDEEDWNGVRVVRLPVYAALASGRAEAAMQIRRRVVDLKRTQRIDLVHLHTMSASTLFHLDTDRAWPSRSVLTMHGAPELPHRSREPGTIAKRLFGGASWIACCSQFVRDRLVAVEGEGALARSSVVYCGIKEPAAPMPRPVVEPRLLCLGRVVKGKGFDVAVAAFASIAARWPRARLVIAGDGPARAELQRQAAELGVAGAIEFPGWIDPARTTDLINAASIVLVPSRAESLGLVAVEAAMLARPVVAARVEGLPEAVEDGVTGRLVAPDDAEGMAQAVLGLLDRPDEADAMGRAGRRRAQDMFGWTRCVDAYESLYRRVLEGAGDERTERAVAAE